MKNKRVSWFLWGLLFVIFLGTPPVFADSVEIASISAHYAHPITGAIADSGNNGAIGQGMTESVLDPQALIETDRAGKIYATIRLHLADQLGGYQIAVENPGSGHFTPVSTQEMQRKGETLDLRFPLSSKKAIIRLELEVQAMGRAVTFFGQFGSSVPGNTDFILSVQPDAAGNATTAGAIASGLQPKERGATEGGSPAAKKSANTLEKTPFFGDDVGLLMKGDPALEKGLKGEGKVEDKAPYGFYTKAFLASFGLCIAVVCFLLFVGGLVLCFGFKKLQWMNDLKEAQAYENENET